MMLITEGFLHLRELTNRIFTVATGALALSVTFKTSIVAGAPNYAWLLSAAWVLLTISILAHLWAQLSQGLYFLNAGIGEGGKETEDNLTTFKWSFVISGICFAFGVIALCSFAVLNNN